MDSLPITAVVLRGGPFDGVLHYYTGKNTEGGVLSVWRTYQQHKYDSTGQYLGYREDGRVYPADPLRGLLMEMESGEVESGTHHNSTGAVRPVR